MSKSIYYFSATGNSLFTASQLAIKLGDTSLISISSVRDKNVISESNIVGIVTPLYCSGLPKIVYNFLSNAVFAKNTYFFLIVTAGFPISGGAGSEMNKLLKKKGQKLSYSDYIKMPDSSIVLFNPEEQNSRQKVITDMKIEKFAKEILEGKISKKFEIPFIDMVMPKLFRKYSSTLDKYFKSEQNCNGCGICSKVCPVNNIEMSNGKPIWKHNCEMCLSCINNCPSKSMEYGRLTQKNNRYRHHNVGLKTLIDSLNK